MSPPNKPAVNLKVPFLLPDSFERCSAILFEARLPFSVKSCPEWRGYGRARRLLLLEMLGKGREKVPTGFVTIESWLKMGIYWSLNPH